jgi:hypothetical protein
MSVWFALSILGLAWVGIIGAFKIKNSMSEPIPEVYHRQFQLVKGPLSTISGKERHLWKKIGRKISLSCTLWERRDPHDAAVKIKGEYERRAGSLERNGVVTVSYGGKSFNLLLKGHMVEFEGSSGVFGAMNLKTGEITGRGSWNDETSLKGPDGSAYREVTLDDKILYLCTWGKGKVLYSPLIVGELDNVGEKDQDLLVCLGALWHSVLNN